LREERGLVQLVKRKEYRIVSMLIVSGIYEVKQVIVYEDRTRMLHLLHEALTELPAVQLIMLSLPFAHIHATFRRC